MEGPGSDEMERALHATFCAAANQLTQLYRMSLQQQRTAYLEGYQRALETVVRWTFQHIQTGHGRPLSPEALLHFLKAELNRAAAEEQLRKADDRREKQTTTFTPAPPSTTPSATSAMCSPAMDPKAEKPVTATPAREASFSLSSLHTALPSPAAPCPSPALSAVTSLSLPLTPKKNGDADNQRKRGIDSLFISSAALAPEHDAMETTGALQEEQPLTVRTAQLWKRSRFDPLSTSLTMPDLTPPSPAPISADFCASWKS